jgi:iron complex transport system ATP-binding protein
MEVKLENLSFHYNRKKQILKNVTLTLPSGKFTAILGPNGSGKTTLMKQINRILTPQAGRITMNGVDAASMSTGDLARTVAYVPQMTGGMMAGSVMDTVMLGRKPYIKWKPSEEDIEIVSNCLMRFHLEGIAQREFNALSGGQKQTVLIARALAQTPRLYLFDEPVSFLDVRNQLEIMTAARELVDRDGKTVIMVLHDLNMALRFADHIVIMKEGNVFAQGAPQEVITEENILAVYGTHAQIRNGEYVITSL